MEKTKGTLKIAKIKAKVIKGFELGKFNELEDIVRADKNKNSKGHLYINDTFKCSLKMANYLLIENKEHSPFIEVMEIIWE